VACVRQSTGDSLGEQSWQTGGKGPGDEFLWLIKAWETKAWETKAWETKAWETKAWEIKDLGSKVGAAMRGAGAGCLGPVPWKPLQSS
jgi:hypothetical protein